MAKADEIITWLFIAVIAVLIITHPAGTAVAGTVADSSFSNGLKYLTGSNQAGGVSGSVASGTAANYQITVPAGG